jgi:hypothetical protein
MWRHEGKGGRQGRKARVEGKGGRQGRKKAREEGKGGGNKGTRIWGEAMDKVRHMALMVFLEIPISNLTHCPFLWTFFDFLWSDPRTGSAQRMP